MKKGLLLFSLAISSIVCLASNPFDFGVDDESVQKKSCAKVGIAGDGKFDIEIFDDNGNASCINVRSLVNVLSKIDGFDEICFTAPSEGFSTGYFEAVVVPALMKAGFDNFSVVGKAFKYESKDDAFVRDFFSYKKAKEESDKKAYRSFQDIKRFENPKGHDDESSDFYEQSGYLSQKSMKKLADEGDREALYWYGRSLIIPLVGGDEKAEEKLDIPQGIKIMEGFSGAGDIRALSILHNFYAGNYRWNDSDWPVSGKKEKDDLYTPYENSNLAEEYRMKLAIAGDSQAFEREIRRLCAEGDFAAAENFVDTYKKDKNVGTRSLVPLMAFYFGCDEKELISWGCMCYGDHFVPGWEPKLTVKDPGKLFKFSKIIAEMNPYHDDALLLAHMYLNGIGTPKDEVKAFEVARKASVSSSYVSRGVPGIAYMGYAYEKGIGVEANAKIAEEYWNAFYEPIPRDHDSAQAILDTARRFYTGFGVPKDKGRAFEILEKSFDIHLAALNDPNLKSMVLSGAMPLARTLTWLYEGKYDEADKNDAKAQIYKKHLEALEALTPKNT